MPAPSPARGSAPTAPRCSRLTQDRQRVFDDLMRLAALDVGDEADAAGILVERGIVEAARLRHARIGGILVEQTRVNVGRRRSGVRLRRAACLARLHSHALAEHPRPCGVSAHLPRPQRLCGAAAHGEPCQRAAFSRAACRQLALAAHVERRPRTASASFGRRSTPYPERGSPIGTAILSYTDDNCKSSSGGQGSIARMHPILAVCCAAPAQRPPACLRPVGCHYWSTSLRDAFMNFASDNTAGMAPEILEAIAAPIEGFALGYGNDDVTRRVERRIGELFEREVAVFLVPTGTAANALALAQVSPPWGAVFSPRRGPHRDRRVRRAGVLRRRAQAASELPGVGCKLAPETLRSARSRYAGHAPHQVHALRRCRSRRRPKPAPSIGRTRSRRWRRSRMRAA